jgi:UDP-2,3-diacylglucosamine pyrophosphatase LpxH
VLSEIRKLSDKIQIVWLNGNHDGPAEIVSHLLGVTVKDEDELISGGRRILLLHGHVFDKFIDRYPIVSKVADWVYRWLQKLDRSHSFAKFAKQRSKIFLRCTQQVESESIAHASSRGFDGVCCGHTHMPVINESGPVAYYNSGCWTERPCTYLSINHGIVELHRVDPVLEPAPEDEPTLTSTAELEPALR